MFVGVNHLTTNEHNNKWWTIKKGISVFSIITQKPGEKDYATFDMMKLWE